jgi:hypothetical protein
MLYDPLPNVQWTAPAMVGATRALFAPVIALLAAPVAALDVVLVAAPVAALDAFLAFAPVAPLVVLGLLEEWQHACPVPPLSNTIRLYFHHFLYRTVEIMSKQE